MFYSKLRRALQLFVRRAPAAVLALAAQTVFLITFAITDAYDSARSGEWQRVVATYLTVVALFGFVHAAFGRRARRPLLVLFGAFLALNFAKLETTGTFDYGFAHENIRELMTPLGRRIAGGNVHLWDAVLFFGLPLMIALWVLRRSRFPRHRRSLSLAAGCAALVFVLPRWERTTHEPLTMFVRSAYRFHTEAQRFEPADGAAAYPLVRTFPLSEQARGLGGDERPRPPVIMLFLESWSGIYTDRVGVDGEPFTPVYNEHRREGLSFDHFYASSIQSSRGRFATLCSLIPLYRGKEFETLSDAPIHCLPEVLREAGYATMIMSASDEPEFEDSESFFSHIGFEDVRFEDDGNRDADPNVWGVGLQDDAFYTEWLQSIEEKMYSEPNRPLFAVGINGSHHYPFRDNPNHVPSASGSTKRAHDFLGSLHAEDAWLTTFYEELAKRPSLRDALVVLVGDHSFPADEHGIHFNGLGAREESFRTAFALKWGDHVPPRLVTDRAGSQLDVAPTITDLLQVKHKTQFVGRSLVANDDVGPPVLMVQPYDGVRLAAVQYPFKLQVHDSAEQEELYDLSRDPDELDDRLHGPALAPQLAVLRAGIERIRTSQAILSAHRVWPEPSTDTALVADDPE